MAQGLGFIEFSTGDVLSAAAANGYLASQTVMVFADASARTSAISTPYEGMMSYLKDTNSTEYYSGSAWVAIGGASGGQTLLSTTTLSGSTTTISSINQTYNQLYIVVTGASVNSTSGAYPNLKPNSSGSSCSLIRQIGTGGTVTNQAIAAANIDLSYNNWAASNTNSAYAIYIDNYASSTNYKPFQYYGQWITAASATEYTNGAGTFMSNTAITSLQFSADTSSFNGGTVKIYGVK